MADNAELEKRAIAEIMKEATLGAERASEVGPSGWKKCPLLKTNKRFLANTIVQHVSSNRLVSRRQRKESPRRKRSNSPDRSTSRNKERVRSGRVEKRKQEESDIRKKHKNKKNKKDKKKEKRSKS